MRVKDVEPYISRAVQSTFLLGGYTIVLDDGSTDGTGEQLEILAERNRSILEIVSCQHQMMDEGRDRTLLLRYALDQDPKWIFTLDGDEELPSETCYRILHAVEEAPPEVTVLSFIFACMWGENEFFRANSHLPAMERLFRVTDGLADYEFKSVYPSNMHCGTVPKIITGERKLLNAFIKYWGYESDEAIRRKLEFYQTNDPGHFEVIRQTVEERKRGSKMQFSDDLDARVLGIHGSVLY